MRYMMIVVVALGAVVLPGCFRYHAAGGAPGSAHPVPDRAWVVSQDPSGLEHLLETPGELQLWEIDRAALQKHYPEITDAHIDEAEPSLKLSVTKAMIENGGIVRFWSQIGEGISFNRTLSRGLFSVRLESFRSDGAFLSADRLAYLQAMKDHDDGELMINLTEAILKQRGIIRTGVEREWFLRDGIGIGLPEESAGVDRLGTIIHIASFFENKYEHRMLDRLDGYGWAIGHLESDVVINGPNAIARQEQRKRRNAYMNELLEHDPDFEQMRSDIYDEPKPDDEPTDFELFHTLSNKINEKYPILDTGLEVYPDTELDAHGRMLAAIMDQRIAEHAYAAQALIEESDRQNPELADKPIVVIGFSAGALVSPAVVARLRSVYPDRAIALVMVGGGGDLLSASIKSVFAEAKIGLDPREGPKPTQQQLSELVDHYRAASKLDPLTLATSIRDIPTLHIYASRDTVVPSATAEAFNTAHGHVDRLVHPLNHETLFFFAPGEVGRIRSWLREQGLAP